MSERALLVVAAALAGLLAGCDNAWRTDMWYQPSRRPEDMPRPEPEHAVPLGAAPRYENRDDTEDLKNPEPATPASLARGKVIFVARCAPCHGGTPPLTSEAAAHGTSGSRDIGRARGGRIMGEPFN